MCFVTIIFSDYFDVCCFRAIICCLYTWLQTGNFFIEQFFRIQDTACLPRWTLSEVVFRYTFVPNFLNTFKVQRPNMRHHAKLCRNRSNGLGDIAIFPFSRWQPSAKLDFQNFRFLSVTQVGKANMHHHTNFHQNRSHGCKDISLNGFQRVLPPSWIFKNLNFWTAFEVRRANMRHSAKFHQLFKLTE